MKSPSCSRFLSTGGDRRFAAILVCLLVAGLAPAARAAETARPNLLFIIFDDWGWRDAGAHGSTWVKTPNFDRIAREGALFKNAFTSNPKCSPCRASILTGRNTWQLKEAVSHNGYFPAGFEVYPDLLERAGYFVGLTGKGWGPGDHQTLAKRTRNPAGPAFEEHTTTPPASGINRKDYAKNFETFLQRRPKNQPFCFWMGFHEPHRAYERDSGVRLGKNLADITVPPYFPDMKVVRGDLADYAIEVEYADGHIGRALETLAEAGELDRTLIVVTSDHGMPFPYVKGQIHEDGFHLPMAMRWGAVVRPGRVVEDFVNVRDLAPTYLEIAGLPVHAQMTGRSLLALLRSPQSGWVENRAEMLVGKERHDLGRPNNVGYPVRALRTKDFLYVHNFHPERWPAGNPETDFGNCDPGPTKELLKQIGGHFYDLSFGKRLSDELYDLRTDPAGVDNVAYDLFYAATVETLRRRMLELLKAEEDPRVLGRAAELERYEYVGGGGNKSYDNWLKAQEAKLAGEPAAAPAPAAKRAGRKK
ncbi:MAG: sulfatase [Verrucomicrobia bacterium]|nr:sulfatase [Verrucomicrobiota bacterium]